MYTINISAAITLTASRKTTQDVKALLLIGRAYATSTLEEVAECRKAIEPLLKVYDEYSKIGLDLRLADDYLSDIEWEYSEERQHLKEWLRNPLNRDNEEYSDIYKDVYGYRP